MIRQAISCDICGAEKRQTNHWFMTYTHGGELRVTAWNANSRSRGGLKHLCGQTCLHKLLDEFIAGTMVSRPQSAPQGLDRAELIAATDASLTSNAAYASPAVPSAAAGALQVMPRAVIAISPARAIDPVLPSAPPSNDPPTLGSRSRRVEAWQRERERERRAAIATHRQA